MPTDPIVLPTPTTSIGGLGNDIVHPGLRKRHWWHVLPTAIDYTIDTDSEWISVDASGSGNKTVTLLPPADMPGQSIIIACSAIMSGNSVIVAAASGWSVDGGSSLSLTAQGTFVHLISDGVLNWVLYIDGR